jgi:hypothetical protein
MPAAWTQEEDNALLVAIPSHGPVCWNAVIAALLGGRSRAAVCSRYSYYLAVATPVGQAKAHAQAQEKAHEKAQAHRAQAKAPVCSMVCLAR